MLEVKNLSAGYQGVPVIKNVDILVPDGEVVSLLGANGAGKTTTLKAIAGLLKPMEGHVILDNNEITGLPPFIIGNKGLTMVPEWRQTFGNMSVYENLLMGGYRIKDKRLFKDTLERVFNLFPSLKKAKNQISRTLSGGQQQMLAIARGLMSKPKILMLDEPSAGLAPKIIDQVYETMSRLNTEEKLGILLVEQSVQRALAVSTKAYVLQRGKIVISGVAKEVAQNPELTSAYLLS